MDFNILNTKADAEAGSVLHFRHPQLGHPLYTGEGADSHGRLIDKKLPHTAVTALVRGLESDHVKEHTRTVAARRLVGTDHEDDPFALAVSLVIELNGVMNGDASVGATDSGLRWFFGRSDNLAVQVINHAQDRANFFKGASLT